MDVLHSLTHGVAFIYISDKSVPGEDLSGVGVPQHVLEGLHTAPKTITHFNKKKK